MKTFFCILFCFLGGTLLAQQKAHYTISGIVHSTEDSAQRLPNAWIRMSGIKNNHVIADSNGVFQLDDLHPGHYHLQIGLIGYHTTDTTLVLSNDIFLNVSLSEKSDKLGNVTVISTANRKNTIIALPQTTLSGQALDNTRGLSLGEALKQIPGVNSLQSGPTISKPVIHGLYSNRILILNNGVRQEGQNWGNDHAPEIDPFIANRLTVVKGPSSLRYGSDAIGGVVLVEAPPLSFQKGIRGEVNTVAMTNGRSGTLSGMLEGGFAKKMSGWAWRVQGTLQKAGNSRAAHYYIPNTAFNQRDFSFALGYKSQNFGMQLYGSEFNSTVGITPTSEDLTYADFQAAIKRGKPLDVYNYFTYKLDSIGARQEIRHRLVKADAYWEGGKWGRLDLVVSAQHNLRKEFGLDPLTYADIPDNRFSLTTYSGDLIWKQPEWIPGFSGNIGLSYLHQHNTIASREQTEVIPNYDNHGSGIYMIEKYQIHHLLFEGGVRYDSKWQQAHLFRRGNAMDNTVDRIYDSTASWKRWTTNIGVTWFAHPHFTMMYNLGTAWRGPNPIELFANGVHMGASRWEKGDPNLKVESAINNNLTFKYAQEKLDIELGFYANFFRNYIYIAPNGTIQNISGYYPLFQYRQAKSATFTGLDLDAKWQFLPHLNLESKVSIVRGRNTAENQWLIYIPADKYDNSLTYSLSNIGKLEKPFLAINNIFVARQSRIPTDITDAAPPADYNIWGISLGATTQIGKQPMEWSVTATNLFNREYKDYLNLFRYYNHDLGQNIALRLKFPF